MSECEAERAVEPGVRGDHVEPDEFRVADTKRCEHRGTRERRDQVDDQITAPSIRRVGRTVQGPRAAACTGSRSSPRSASRERRPPRTDPHTLTLDAHLSMCVLYDSPRSGANGSVTTTWRRTRPAGRPTGAPFRCLLGLDDPTSTVGNCAQSSGRSVEEHLGRVLGLDPQLVEQLLGGPHGGLEPGAVVAL